MKKRGLSILVILCMADIFLTVTSCCCADGDCQGVPQKIQSETPQCHHAAAQATGNKSSRKECCGKCLIEKTAIFERKLSLSGDIHKTISVETELWSDFHANLRRTPFSQKAFPELPPGFFIQHIFNTSFSFRGPPQG